MHAVTAKSSANCTHHLVKSDFLSLGGAANQTVTKNVNTFQSLPSKTGPECSSTGQTFSAGTESKVIVNDRYILFSQMR